MTDCRRKQLGLRLNQSQGFYPRKKKGIAVSIFKCTNCGLIYSNPMPKPENINDHYGIDSNVYWPDEYFRVSDQDMVREVNTVKRLMKVQPGMKALDIGAGIGKAIIALQKQGFDAFGLEPSQTFFEYALNRMKIPEDRIICSSIEEAEFSPNQFDFINLFNVVEHVSHPYTTIEKAIKWLKPGGLIHIEVPYSKYLVSRIINTYYNLVGTNYVTHISPMHVPYHLYEFHQKSFEIAVKRSGGSIVEMKVFAGGAVGIPFAESKLLRNIMKWTDTGPDITVWITKNGVTTNETIPM